MSVFTYPLRERPSSQPSEHAQPGEDKPRKSCDNRHVENHTQEKASPLATSVFPDIYERIHFRPGRTPGRSRSGAYWDNAPIDKLSTLVTRASRSVRDVRLNCFMFVS